ncbi:hypothetical protein [Amycolatopsis sp. 195334CR]|uniref:hypothetical protein n=1 Tax=Amycolatopsis sp. 195334CR TaxID=2814588 RepID=UPI001A8D154F|nr:hypothetical protein [Amycolatopsis sp. 195334CR]MBN6038471.1 hypothetical protein [Amycolatopsis sp. 195334CR]
MREDAILDAVEREAERERLQRKLAEISRKYPGRLHSHLLCVTRSRAGTDPIDAVHRVTLSCPGPDWCHRGGCVETIEPELNALLSWLSEAGQTSGAMTGQG